MTLTDLLTGWPGGPEGPAARAIRRAWEVAQQVHGEAARETGERYADYGLAVAHIMKDLDVDANTIIASILHEVLLPHAGWSLQKLKREFNEEVATLVSALNNLRAYAQNAAYLPSHPTQQAMEQQKLEQIRRAILSIIEGDIRVILIRMADALHSLRRAGGLPEARQHELASEAMHIYAPLANRLGIWQFKWELEDLAFRYLEPEQYQEIKSALAARRAERTTQIQQAAVQLKERLEQMGFTGSVTGRPKHIYSIYRKMQRKNVDFEHIYDIQALRIILRPTDEAAYARMGSKERDDADRALCYQVLGAVHSLWQPIPREFDDYIASPKPNGYKSLHTAVIDKQSGQTLEVQIRTARMHEEAEKGVAAHWAYKEEGEARVSAYAQRRIQSLRELLAAIQDSDEDGLDAGAFETEMEAERIYVFTPSGDVKDLPFGSTPIDFAYQVHTAVGHRCRGARVNGKMVSLDYKLSSGDKVEIITAKRPGPSRDWMNPSLGYTGSARTRSKIRQWFREQEREKNIEQGLEVVQRELKRLGLTDTFSVEDIAGALKFDKVDKFLAKVGFGDIQTAQIGGALALMRRDLKPDDELRPLLQPPQKKPVGLTVRGLSGLHTRMAKCCNPIPPEPIIGYITRGQGVTIHRQDCKQLVSIGERERLIEVDWGVDAETYPIPIVVKAYRRPGLIDEMNAILRGQGVDVPKTKRTTDDSMMTIYLIVDVVDLEQLNWLMKKFENLPNVVEVSRQRWA